MAENQACLRERKKDQAAGARSFHFGDFEGLGNGEGAEQQIEAIAAGFAVLVEDDERAEETEGDAKERGGRGEPAAHRGEENQEGCADAERRIETEREVAESEEVRPGPRGEIKKRHAGAAKVRHGVEQVQQRGVAQFGNGEDFVAPHLLAQRPEDAGGEERGDAKKRKNPAEERAGGLLLLSRFA